MTTPAPDAIAADRAWDEVRGALTWFSKPFPHEAIALAHERREEIAPHLVDVLVQVARDPSAAADGEYMLHLFAMALLACWRDIRAWRPLLEIARFGEKVHDALLGDSVHDLYPRALASVCDGDLRLLQELANDTAVSIWARVALLDAWKFRVMEGDAPLEPFEQFLLDLGQRAAERLRHAEQPSDDVDLLSDVASQACDVGSALLLEPVRSARREPRWTNCRPFHDA